MCSAGRCGRAGVGRVSEEQRLRLQERLCVVEKALEHWLPSVAGTPEWEIARALQEEQGQIEIALAQLEVASATRAAAAAQLASAQALDRESEERERARAAGDDVSFWYRRFILSLQIGHAAAVLAIIGGTLQADDPKPVAAAMVWPGLFFAHGLLAAGMLPALQALHRLTRTNRDEKAIQPDSGKWGLSWTASLIIAATLLSTGLFVLGTYAAMMSFDRLASGPSKVVEKASAAPPKTPPRPVVASSPPRPSGPSAPEVRPQAKPTGTEGAR